jgi:hypothetical protein
MVSIVHLFRRPFMHKLMRASFIFLILCGILSCEEPMPVSNEKVREETQVIAHPLYIINSERLYSVNQDTGDRTMLRSTVWSSPSGMTFIGANMYIQQLYGLFRVDNTGLHTNLGMEWDGTQGMTALQGSLYIIRKGTLWKVNKDNGSRVSLGTTGAWPDVKAITSLGGWLYILTSTNLYRVSANDGSFGRMGRENQWGGSDLMTSVDEAICPGNCGGTSVRGIYVLKQGTLWRIPNNIDPAVQVGGTNWWPGASAITSKPSSADQLLYIVWGNRLWLISPLDGSYRTIGNTVWSSTKAMVMTTEFRNI